nr:MAG TPA: hypothetical protein [Caudoviricetes sp.]
MKKDVMALIVSSVSIAHIICAVLINGGMNNEHKNSERFKY